MMCCTFENCLRGFTTTKNVEIQKTEGSLWFSKNVKSEFGMRFMNIGLEKSAVAAASRDLPAAVTKGGGGKRVRTL